MVCYAVTLPHNRKEKLFMDTIFEKLDRMSRPIGALLDTVLARLAPQTTAAACGNRYYCGDGCGGYCDHFGDKTYYKYFAASIWDCQNHTNLTACYQGCFC
jgi:hypothetical protein